MSDLNKTQLIGGKDSDGNLVPLKVASDGTIGISGSGGSSGGDASAANQEIANDKLTSIDDNFGSVDSNLIESSVPEEYTGSGINGLLSFIGFATEYTRRILDGIQSILGSPSDNAPSSDTETTTFIGYFKRLLVVKLGEEITGTTIPTGGSGIRGLLSWIAKLISDRTNTLGAKTAAQSMPVTLATDGVFSANFGATNDASATTDTGNFSLLAFVKRLVTAQSSLNTKVPTGLTVTSNRLLVDTGLSSNSVSGTYNATSPTLSDTQTAPLQLNSRGDLITTFVDRITSTGTITVRDTNSTFFQSWGNTFQNIYTGTSTAGSFVSINCSGNSAFSVNLTGTFTGTISFEKSFDDGASWVVTSVCGEGTNYSVNSTNNFGKFVGNCAGCTNVRVRSIAVMTGSVTAKIMLGVGTNSVSILNGVRLFDRVSGAEATIKLANILPTSSDTSTVVSLRELPTLAATSTLQTTGNTSLNNIDSKVPALGQALAAGSIPVVLTAAQITALTPPTSITATVGTTQLSLLSTVNAAGIGSTVPLTTAYKNVTAQLRISSGTVSAINCLIQGSLTGTTNDWYTLCSITDPTAGAVISNDGKAFLYLRANLISISGGGSVSVFAVAV